MIRPWEKLPVYMQNQEVRRYYNILQRKKTALVVKRVFDFAAALILLVVLSPIMAALAVWIKLDSKGPVFYRQERITQYGETYRIMKFRTMVADADERGPLITGKNDSRITRVGEKLRKCRLDEIPQLLNVIKGEMTFVGTRPEVPQYVSRYSDSMYATLLLPAGITSRTSIVFKNEEELLEKYMEETGHSADEVYAGKILPIKMNYNLKYIRDFGMFSDLAVMLQTVFAVIK